MDPDAEAHRDQERILRRIRDPRLALESTEFATHQGKSQRKQDIRRDAARTPTVADVRPSMLVAAEQGLAFPLLRGIHILVHTIYGPDMQQAYNVNALDPSPFQTSTANVPGMWLQKKQAVTDYVEGASLTGEGVTRSERSQFMLSQWMPLSINEMVKLNPDETSKFSDVCFSIDIEPPASIEGLSENNRTRSNTKQMNVDQKPLADQLADARDAAREQRSELQKYFWNNVLQFAGLQAEYDTLEDGTSGSAFLNDDTWSNWLSIKSLLRSNALLVAINDFMMNRYQGYDVSEGHFAQHVFVQVIGFTSYQDWLGSNKDEHYTSSRMKAWRSWRSEMLALGFGRDTIPTSRIDLAGVYMIQQHKMKKLYSPHLTGDVIQTSDNAFNQNQLYSQMVPLTSGIVSVNIYETDNVEWGTLQQLMMYELSEESGLRERLQAALVLVLQLTRVPAWFAQSPAISCIADGKLALSENLYFKRGEIQWDIDAWTRGNFEQLTGGRVSVKLAWKESDKVRISRDGESDRYTTFRHGHLLLSSLREQLAKLNYIQTQTVRYGEQWGSNVATNMTMPIETFQFRRITEAGELENVNLQHIRDDIKECEHALSIVRRSVYRDILSDNTRSDVIEYETTVAADVILTIQRRNISSLSTFALNFIMSDELELDEGHVWTLDNSDVVVLHPAGERVPFNLGQSYADRTISAGVFSNLEGPNDVVLQMQYNTKMRPQKALLNENNRNDNQSSWSTYSPRFYTQISNMTSNAELMKSTLVGRKFIRPVYGLGASGSNQFTLHPLRLIRASELIARVLLPSANGRPQPVKYPVRPLSLYEWVRCVRDILRALNWLHSMGVMLDSANTWQELLLDDMRRISICNFSSATMVGNYGNSTIDAYKGDQSRVAALIDAVMGIDDDGTSVTHQNLYSNPRTASFVGCCYNPKDDNIIVRLGIPDEFKTTVQAGAFRTIPHYCKIMPETMASVVLSEMRSVSLMLKNAVGAGKDMLLFNSAGVTHRGVGLTNMRFAEVIISRILRHVRNSLAVSE